MKYNFIITLIGLSVFCLAFVFRLERRKRGGGHSVPIIPINPRPPTYLNEYAFDRNGYLALAKFVPYPNFNIKLSVRTYTNSLLFGMGYEKDLFMPTITCWTKNGNLYFFTYSGPNEHQIRFVSKSIVTDGKWHDIEIDRCGNEWTVRIDSVIENRSIEPTIVSYPHAPLYVGDKPQPDTDRLDAFSGCIRNITVNGANDPQFEIYGGVANGCGYVDTKENSMAD